METDETFGEYVDSYFNALAFAVSHIKRDDIYEVSDCIAYTQYHKGRLFILGVGGSAGNASHAVNDFRKICGIEAYAPTDNVSELTARINDENWESCFSEWLKVSQLNEKDTVMILSVGGGDYENQISVNLIAAIAYAEEVKAGVVGIVGKSTGYTAKHADACVVIPEVEKRFTTPITESMQAVIWHLIANEPGLAKGV